MVKKEDERYELFGTEISAKDLAKIEIALIINYVVLVILILIKIFLLLK